jgi:hypothetical protein
MKFSPHKFLLVAVLVSFGFGSSYSAPQGKTPDSRTGTQQKIKESDAISALVRLGVPMQRDPKGVVRWIEATKGEFNDEALAYLPSLSGLEWLEIGSGNVSATGAAHLKGCTALKRLYVHDIKLGGDELSWLSNLKGLEALSLQRTGINGAIIKNLASSDTLTVLNLSGNPISDADAASIARIKGLEVLALAETKITGLGIAKFEGMPRLNELNLMRCDIQDSDLTSFVSMPNLRIVYAEGCPITDFGIQAVISRFPMLAIFH